MPDVNVGSLKVDKRKCISVVGSHKYQNRFDIFIEAVALIMASSELTTGSSKLLEQRRGHAVVD